MLLLGSGPSSRLLPAFASAFAFDRIIAVNDSWRLLGRLGLFSHPHITLFSLDQNWIRRNRDLIRSKRLYWDSFFGTAENAYVALPTGEFPDIERIQDVTYLDQSYANGLSEDWGAIHTGGHSGYGALNLAYLKRAQRIYLLGYDMDPAENQQYEYWAQNFNQAIPQLASRQVMVYNLSNCSHIAAFLRPFNGVRGAKIHTF